MELQCEEGGGRGDVEEAARWLRGALGQLRSIIKVRLMGEEVSGELEKREGGNVLTNCRPGRNRRRRCR